MTSETRSLTVPVSYRSRRWDRVGRLVLAVSVHVKSSAPVLVLLTIGPRLNPP